MSSSSSQTARRRKQWTFQKASNVILTLLVLHWCYMISQMLKHDYLDNSDFMDKQQQQQQQQEQLPEPHEPYDFDFHTEWHPAERKDRFPSVQDRVRIYMGNWYLPPCSHDDLLAHKIEMVDGWPRVTIGHSYNHDDDDASHNDTHNAASDDNAFVQVDSIVDADTRFLLTRDAIRDCARTIPEMEQQQEGNKGTATLATESRVRHRLNLQSYCSEVVGLIDYMAGLDYFTPKAEIAFSMRHREPRLTPIIAQFGDNIAGPPTNPQIPIISKWRAAATPSQLLKVTTSSSTTEAEMNKNHSHRSRQDDECLDLQSNHAQRQRPALNITAHHLYEGISPIIWKLEMCRHWDPLEMARTLDWHWHEKKLGALWRGDLTGSKIHEHALASPDVTDEQICFANQRCQFVFDHRNSPYIHAGLSDGLNWLKGNGTISGVPVVKDRVTMQQIQQYKVIISFEGNDVASGLKWSLLSESVVLMPTPTKTSWAMEELLEPWVHYIPMHANGSNADEMIEWVRDHDEEAHRIAERGRLFMYDLVYHPDAAREEQLVKAEIARRYRALWQ